MRQQGFVLMTIVLLLTVVTTLVLANLRWVALDWKRCYDLHHYQQKLRNTEQIAEQVAGKFANNPGLLCGYADQLTPPSSAVLLERGCRISEHYRYLITDLGLFPCIKLSSKLSTRHWLLSMLDEQLPNHRLQFRIVSAEPSQPCPGSAVIVVQTNILTRMWLV